MKKIRKVRDVLGREVYQDEEGVEYLQIPNGGLLNTQTNRVEDPDKIPVFYGMSYDEARVLVGMLTCPDGKFPNDTGRITHIGDPRCIVEIHDGSGGVFVIGRWVSGMACLEVGYGERVYHVETGDVGIIQGFHPHNRFLIRWFNTSDELEVVSPSDLELINEGFMPEDSLPRTKNLNQDVIKDAFPYFRGSVNVPSAVGYGFMVSENGKEVSRGEYLHFLGNVNEFDGFFDLRHKNLLDTKSGEVLRSRDWNRYEIALNTIIR